MRLALCCLLAATSVLAEDPVDLVDPLIGTATPRYDYFAAAALPFGMVALSPDTKHGELWNGGYRHGDPFILSFSHVHNIQLAGVPVMPLTGGNTAHLGLDANKATFSRATEIAKPGYHRLELTDRNVTVELTATCRAGLHRYTFPATNEVHLAFDLSATLGPCAMSNAFALRVSDREIAGWSTMKPTHRRKTPCTVYFVARFDRPFDRFAGWKPVDGTNQPCEAVENEIAGPGSGCVVTFRELAEPRRVQLKVGISFTSIEQARLNLDTELPGWDFDAVVAAARSAWRDHLARIDVEGGPREQRVKFYTDLFRTAVGKRVYSDVDGRYADYTGPAPVTNRVPLDAAGRPAFRLLDMDCLWGAQWNLNLLWPLAWPDAGNEVAQSFLQYWRTAGTLPRGPWGGRDVYVMVGDPTTPFLAAMVCQGRNTFDLREAYAAARKNAFPGGVRDRSGYEAVTEPTGGGMPDYVAKGYVPVEVQERTTGWHSGGTALTLEYAHQDWCLAELARRIGAADDRALFLRRALNYTNVYDAATGWMRPRHGDGSWMEPFAPTGDAKHANRGFVEGNAAVYTFFVPHDVSGLARLMGGPERLVARLEESFRQADPHAFSMPHGEHARGWIEYGNQPSGALAHLFAHAGAPERTQFWVRQVRMRAFGGTTPESGYAGDEDQGQLGALSALMAVGLFDVQGGVGEEPDWELTAPLFERIRIALGTGRTLEIRVRGQRLDHPYLRSVVFNGKPVRGFAIPARDLLAGGVLELETAAEPAQGAAGSRITR